MGIGGSVEPLVDPTGEMTDNRARVPLLLLNLSSDSFTRLNTS